MRNAPTSEPACGSVRFIVPDHSPELSLGKNIFFISSFAWVSIASICPCVINGLSARDKQALDKSSLTQVVIIRGKPKPPYFVSPDMPIQPPSAIELYALKKLSGKITFPSFKIAGFISPSLLIGEIKFSDNFFTSSSIPSKVSSSQKLVSRSLNNSFILKKSFIKNLISFIGALYKLFCLNN